MLCSWLCFQRPEWCLVQKPILVNVSRTNELSPIHLPLPPLNSVRSPWIPPVSQAGSPQCSAWKRWLPAEFSLHPSFFIHASVIIPNGYLPETCFTLCSLTVTTLFETRVFLPHVPPLQCFMPPVLGYPSCFSIL